MRSLRLGMIIYQRAEDIELFVAHILLYLVSRELWVLNLK
jgi:hypothetical protein